MVASLGLHGRIDIPEDDEGLPPHANIALSDDLGVAWLTSMISPYSSKMVKSVSLS